MNERIELTAKELTNFVEELVGKPFKDEWGNDLGTVEKSYLDEKRKTVIAVIRLHDGKLVSDRAL